MCSHSARRSPAPRGFTLIAVLVIVGSALLAATSMLFIAQAEVAGASHAGRVAQSRASVESAIDVIMQRLDAQREVILDGDLPALDEQYELYEVGRHLGVVRLLPVTPDQRRLEPQAAKLDINSEKLTAEMLVSTGMIDEAVAQAIIDYRQRTPGGLIHTIGELLSIDQITADMLYGPVEDMVEDDTSLEEGDITERVGARFVNDEPRGLADLLTVFAVEPQLQRDGVRRINVNVPWSSELGRRLDDRFGEGAGDIVQSIIESGTTFDDLAVLVRVLNNFDVPVEDWPDILDGLTTNDETYAFGRLDINTASEAALLALPEMMPEQAAELIRVRDTLSSSERATVAWPAMHGIIEPDAYEQLLPWLTNRSWTYRIRFATGEVDADNPDQALHNPTIYEAVIDLAAPRPRIAYLRDVTMMRTAAMLVSTQEGNSLTREWYEEQERWAEPAPEEDTALTDWPDEEVSWQIDDLADEREQALPLEAEPTRQRLGRWRGSSRSSPNLEHQN